MRFCDARKTSLILFGFLLLGAFWWNQELWYEPPMIAIEEASRDPANEIFDAGDVLVTGAYNATAAVVKIPMKDAKDH